MSFQDYKRANRRRAHKFGSVKKVARRRELELAEDELKFWLEVAQSRTLSSEEGKALNSLAKKVRRLRRKVGSQENCDAQDIPS